MDPIIKWKGGKYSRLVLPHEINFETKFYRHKDFMYGIVDTVENPHLLSSFGDVYEFLDTNTEYLFDSLHIGKMLWNDIGVSYCIDQTEYIVNIPSISFPYIDNYAIQRLGPINHKLCPSVYTKQFFSTKKNVSLNTLHKILENQNG